MIGTYLSSISEAWAPTDDSFTLRIKMDKIRELIKENYLKSGQISVSQIYYDGKFVSIENFTDSSFRYTSCSLWLNEYYCLVRKDRTTWIDMIICFFMMRNPVFKFDIPLEFIKENKHLLVKMIRNGSTVYEFDSVNMDIVIEGDKYLLKELKMNKVFRKQNLNKLQAYCQASYTQFHLHNDWDLTFLFR